MNRRLDFTIDAHPVDIKQVKLYKELYRHYIGPLLLRAVGSNFRSAKSSSHTYTVTTQAAMEFIFAAELLEHREDHVGDEEYRVSRVAVSDARPVYITYNKSSENLSVRFWKLVTWSDGRIALHY